MRLPRPAPARSSAAGVTVSYGEATIIAGVDLDVPAGSSLAVLGPSGSGKTTLLHVIAGFVDPAAGEIRIGGRLVARPGHSLPPERRNVGVVFQGFALWPHMTAVDTVAYPYRRRGVPANEARRRALDLLGRLHIGGLADRYPAQLSGGEQQRVGLARALAREASIYLFDEPTAHLDTDLRAGLQAELTDQRSRLGAAAIHATHDVSEAMAVADRVALLRAGRVVQVGTPTGVYERPVDLWAARLTGPASVLEAPVIGVDESRVRLRIADREVTVVLAEGGVWLPAVGGARLDHLHALVRPEWVRLSGDLPGRVRQAWYRGPHTDYRLETPAGPVDARESGPPHRRIGEQVGWRIERAWLVHGGGDLAAAHDSDAARSSDTSDGSALNP